VVDAQSPGRVEFLDRYNDGPGEPLLFGSAYRPQELLTPHVSDSLVAAVERVGIGPVRQLQRLFQPVQAVGRSASGDAAALDGSQAVECRCGPVVPVPRVHP
jgi:hypothetical protein